VLLPSVADEVLDGLESEDPGENSILHSSSRDNSSPTALVTVKGTQEKFSGVVVSVTILVLVVGVETVYRTIEVLVIRQSTVFARSLSKGAAEEGEEVDEASVGGG
jgi:hypothetical protein